MSQNPKADLLNWCDAAGTSCVFTRAFSQDGWRVEVRVWQFSRTATRRSVREAEAEVAALMLSFLADEQSSAFRAANGYHLQGGARRRRVAGAPRLCGPVGPGWIRKAAVRGASLSTEVCVLDAVQYYQDAQPTFCVVEFSKRSCGVWVMTGDRKSVV